ncbi:ECF-type riboflavin transport system, substrate-binding protein [Candidatus Phytoplasma solani]|uniref:ECF-type riboflavin transporter substrate-binding protein n=1 Tax=Candidatus Phytoplasma solani TaxID=69896 RepID=UPI0032DAC703
MTNLTSVKQTVTIAVSAAIYVILSCFASIPIGHNVVLETSSPFLVFVAVLFGPIVGFYVGLLGHTIKDFLIFGNVCFNWVICSGILGFLYGLPQKTIDLKHQPFNLKKIISFWLYQVFANCLVFGLIAPISDLWIYAQPCALVFFQGFLVVISNIVSYSLFGISLMLKYSNNYVKKEVLS